MVGGRGYMGMFASIPKEVGILIVCKVNPQHAKTESTNRINKCS
jgi:hypothetical protein